MIGKFMNCMLLIDSTDDQDIQNHRHDAEDYLNIKRFLGKQYYNTRLTTSA